MINYPKFHNLAIALLLLLITLMSIIYVPVSAQEKVRGQLSKAVAANSEAELQRFESANPRTEEAALARLLRGYLRLQEKDYALAANLLNDPGIGSLTNLGDYALYFRGQALMEAGRKTEAEGEFRRLANSYPTSLIARSALLQAAGSAMMRSDYRAVVDVLTPLIEKNDGTALKLRADALDKLGRANEAVATLQRLYFEAPQSAEAEKAAERLTNLAGSVAPADALQLRRRADKLYQFGLYLIAAQAYNQLTALYPGSATNEDYLRAGVAFYKANQFPQAIAALVRVRGGGLNLMSEAYYHHAMANLSMNNEAAALQTLANLRRLASGNRQIAELLYGLGRYHEKRNRESQAAAYYLQLVRQFPDSENADQAHYWLAWRAHEAKDYVTAARMLTEHVANYDKVTENRGKAGFWAAVDSERTGDRGRALALYRALLTRYSAGWYGINAERRIAALTKEGSRERSVNSDLLLRRAVEGMQTINLPKETVREADLERVRKADALMLIALHESAMNELEAARENALNSPIVNLRMAQIYRTNGENVTAINALKRAYPDYGQMLPEEMPREVWEVFYPLKWWSNIKEEARRHGLDPYLIAGIIRQETVFEPQARSRSNAYGLMQLLPSTGIAVSRRMGGGRISTSDLYNPVLNIQLGTAYVKELLDKFGRFEYVAAAYNGGETRVRRWLRERPPGEIEEWVEDIPISETRLYVQGVYRNARQYIRLYDEQGRFRSNVPVK
jgi:soluble lytic murein transglycosylase